MESNSRILILYDLDPLGKKFHPIGFRTADADISSGDLPQGFELLLCLAHHIQNILCPLPQKHSLIGQTDIVITTDKQFLSKLSFQFLQLL